MRGLGARTKETLQEAVRLAIAAITRHDATAWFAHAEFTNLHRPLIEHTSAVQHAGDAANGSAPTAVPIAVPTGARDAALNRS